MNKKRPRPKIIYRNGMIMPEALKRARFAQAEPEVIPQAVKQEAPVVPDSPVQAIEEMDTVMEDSGNATVRFTYDRILSQGIPMS